ncbi:hypothetical protein GCM10009761_10960 [Agromyces terreus]
MHNVEPHETGSKLSRWLTHQFDEMTTAWITMDPVETNLYDRPVYVVPHGDYEPIYGSGPAVTVDEGLVICFGHIRRYKGLERLVSVVRTARSEYPLRLTIAGPPDDPELTRSLRKLSRIESWFDLDARRLSDEDLARSICSAELVVLPYEHLYNSGAAMLALTLSRPILLPATSMSRRLRAEVGSNWVHLYNQSLQSEDILSALRSIRDSLSDSVPDLQLRSWTLLGEQFATIYRDCLASGVN